MIEPDRKNGNFVSETSQGAPIGFLFGLLGLTAFVYHFFDGWFNITVWCRSIIFLIVIWVLVAVSLNRRHENPNKKKFYFRSGENASKTFYSAIEIEEIDSKQKMEPQKLLECEGGVVFWRYKKRSWIAKEEAGAGEIKTAIEDFLRKKYPMA